MKTWIWLGLLVAPLFASAQECASDTPIVVQDAWARLAPPGAAVMAGYAQLSHAGAGTVSITGASSRDFERVEMHSMTMDDGVMRMRKLDQLDVLPGQTLELAPGGLHLMLIGPKRAFAAGDEIAIELSLCAGASTQPLHLTLRAGP